MDRLDMLLQEGNEPKKVSKTFNISEDIAGALEALKPGVRSKVVDLALRTVLTEKGLLSKNNQEA